MTTPELSDDEETSLCSGCGSDNISPIDELYAAADDYRKALKENG
jgi:hypothetical protein